MQTGFRLAVGLSSPPHHHVSHYNQHLDQSNGTSNHAAATQERVVATGSIFRKSLVALPADSERRRDGGSELFMIKAAPVTGLTTEDVVEQMRICREQHSRDQEMTLLTLSVVPATVASNTLFESSTVNTVKRPIDSEPVLPNSPTVTDVTPLEAAGPLCDSEAGSSENSRDVSEGAALSDRWEMPSPAWKRARMRSEDDGPEEPIADSSDQDATVPCIVQPSTPEEADHSSSPSEPASASTLALVTAPANDTQLESRIDGPVSSDDATTPVNTHPPLTLPSPTNDAHSRSRTFSPPTLLEAFTSSEPVLSPIQSYFGSDPYSPSNFSFPRHDHYLGSILTDDHNTQSGDSRMPVDDYHGFATHPWSEQSTPSHVLSHRWTRRVASSDGVPVLNSTVSRQGFIHHTNRYERTTTRRSRHFAPAMMDRPWHELRSALPFASLSTATVTARTTALSAVDSYDGGSGSESDDLYETDRDLLMAQLHQSSHDVAEADEHQMDDQQENYPGDEDGGDELLRTMGRDSTSRLREIRQRLQAQSHERDVLDEDRDEEEDVEDDGDNGNTLDELIDVEEEEEEDEDGLDVGSYDTYGEYEMAYDTSFDHNHNLQYSDEEGDLEDDEEFGYSYQLDEMSHSSTSPSRTPDQHLGSGEFNLPIWGRGNRPSPLSTSHTSSSQSHQRSRHSFRGVDGLDPGLELQDIEDDTELMDGGDENEIEVDDDMESLRPLDEDEEDELALMLGYENRRQNRRQQFTLPEWRPSTWRMPRVGTAHHPGQSTTALSSDQYDGRDGSQPSEESDEALARRLQNEEYANVLRRRELWLNNGSLPSHSVVPASTLHRFSRSHRRAASSSHTPSQPALEHESGPSSPRRSLFSFSPLSVVTSTTSTDNAQAPSTSSSSTSPSEPTVSALRRNQPTTTTSTATTSTPRLHSSQSRWHTSSTRSRLLVRMLEDRPRRATMVRRRRYRAEDNLAFSLTSPWMEPIWGNPADYLDDDQVDDSYEGLLRLSEQIGDAKPRGVPTKVLRMLDRYLFSWHSLHDGQDHPSMLAHQRNRRTENSTLGATGAGVKLFGGSSQPGNETSVGSSSSSVPPHPLVVRKVRSVSQLKSSAGTGNTPLSATASTSGALGAASNSSAMAGGSDGGSSGSSDGSNNNNLSNDDQLQQLRRVTRRISQDCLRERRLGQNLLSSQKSPKECSKPSLDLPGLADTCTICLQTYEAKDWLRPLPCRHAFHMGCIDTWLANNCQCPICRQEVNQARIESMVRGA
ncbi:E3 ubiquitin-protein ligase rnf6 [Actinomortierella wolfii]|nr:E3 ubiquitin-protein ligase rnf6 [Actinomortierella wolfii]